MGAQKAPDSKQTIEQKEQRKMHHNIWFQIILDSHSHRNSMVLAQKQTCKPREQNQRPRANPSYIHLPDSQQRNKQTNKYTEEKTTSSINSAGKTRHPCVRGMKLVSSVSGNTKVISEWIKDFVSRQETDNARGKVRKRPQGMDVLHRCLTTLKNKIKFLKCLFAILRIKYFFFVPPLTTYT